MPQTPTSRDIVNKAMGGQLSRFLTSKRRAEVPVRVMVEEIHKRTDVLVTERTVTRWLDDLGLVEKKETR